MRKGERKGERERGKEGEREEGREGDRRKGRKGGREGWMEGGNKNPQRRPPRQNFDFAGLRCRRGSVSEK